MNYVLFYSPGSTSMAVHWMLLELGVPFDAVWVKLHEGEQHSREYRKISPLGRVPALFVDGETVCESSALLMLLAERHPEGGLAPLPGSEHRAVWLETMIFFANTLLPAMRDWFYADQDGAAELAPTVRQRAQQRIEQAWETLDAQLGRNGEYLVGDALSTVDLMAVMLMYRSREMARPATQWPRLKAYAERLTARPAYQQLQAREALSGWL
ncbi:glutathione S-transferase family protein [Chimaeribacter arupi]|uniref:Glutathione S-transferase n=1 Tax=Chimaeribacter arupi TaxID=2060066 RepID=A0A2N5EMW9_9GAMM|nr:glutathione S-transferase family protein [Chimaeribacter arupi]PLR49803.1 glutathione S-transferase [Chimaeribacter arupi]